MNFIDTHMHVVPSEFDDYKEVIKNAFNNNVQKMFIVGCEKKTIKETIKTAKEFNNVYPIIGIHPNNVTGNKDIKFIKKHFNDQIVGIGEIGLDLSKNDNPPLKLQIKVLEDHLNFALIKNIPIIIHSRNADKETFKILNQQKYTNLKFIIIHSYSYGLKSMQKYLNIGCYLSFNGIVTFKNATEFKEAVKKIPLNRILSETDSPCLAPVPHRGKKNEPSFVIDVVKYIAKLKKISTEKVAKSIEKNVYKIFGI